MLTAILIASMSSAIGSAFRFTGTFEPIEGTTNSGDIWPAALATDFSGVISWPPDVSSYSEDLQPEDSNWGVYSTTSVDISFAVDGSPLFSQRPTQFLWSSRNDSLLHVGATQYFGDELKLSSVGIRSMRLVVGESPVPRGMVIVPTVIDIDSELMLVLRAIDTQGKALQGDRSAIQFDPTQFDLIFFEMKQSFVMYNSPRTYSWRGRIRSIDAIPEPDTCSAMATLCIVLGLFRRQVAQKASTTSSP